MMEVEPTLFSLYFSYLAPLKPETNNKLTAAAAIEVAVCFTQTRFLIDSTFTDMPI